MPMHKMFISLLSAMAEGERHRVVKRRTRRVADRKRGTKFGRKLKLTDHQQVTSSLDRPGRWI
jgi:DNA invertase Pin-like site-specific DNA recombinase